MNIQKLEIIISNMYLEELVNHLERIGLNGYTAIEVARGKGAREGEHLADGLLPTTRSTLLISIVTEETAKEIFDDLHKYIEKRKGVMFTVPVMQSMGVSLT